MLARLVGGGLVLVAGWLWLQGQPALVVAIAAGAGVAVFLSGGLSRS